MTVTVKRTPRPRSLGVSGAALGLLALLAPTLASCRATAGTPRTSPEVLGAVTGTLRLDVGIAALPNGSTVPGRVTAVNREGRRYPAVVARGGRFTLRLPPDRYELSGTSPRFDGGTSSACEARPITVRARQTVHRDVICEGM